MKSFTVPFLPIWSTQWNVMSTSSSQEVLGFISNFSESSVNKNPLWQNFIGTSDFKMFCLKCSKRDVRIFSLLGSIELILTILEILGIICLISTFLNFEDTNVICLFANVLVVCDLHFYNCVFSNHNCISNNSNLIGWISSLRAFQQKPFINNNNNLKMEMKKLNLSEIGLKAWSKNEIYWLLVTEANLFLPPQRDCPSHFLHELCVGKKR